MKKESLVSLVVGLSAVSLFGLGCNPLQDAQDRAQKEIGSKVAESVVGGLTGGKVDLGSDGETVEYKDNKTGNSVAIGENAKIPEDFPKDLPLYPGAKPNAVTMTRTGQKEASVTLASADESSKVVKWYEAEMKARGWAEDESRSMGTIETRTYSNASATANLSVFSQDKTEDKEARSMIVIGWKAR